MRAAMLAVLCLLCIACTSKQSTTTTPSNAPAPAELEVLERFQTLSEYVTRSNGRCDRVATSIDTWMQDNATVVAQLMDRARAQPTLDSADLQRVEARLGRIFDRILTAVSACQGQAEATAAYQRFDTWLEST